MHLIPPAQQNSAQGFTRAFPAICRVLPLLLYICVSDYTAPPALRWSVSQRPDAPAPIPDTTATPGRYTGQHIRLIIIMYIRVRRCYVSMPARRGLYASHARRLAIWHPPPGGAVWQQVRGGRRGTTGGLRRISFRAFAR